MSERTDQRTRVGDDTTELSDLGPEVGRDAGSETASNSGPSRLRRLGGAVTAPLEGVFSVRPFLVLLAVTVVTALFARLVLPLGGLAGYLGIATIGLVVGLAGERSRYVESVLAGALAAGLGALLGNLMVTALGLGVPVVAIGVGAGGLSGLLGHYFGRDLRTGLTRDL